GGARGWGGGGGWQPRVRGAARPGRDGDRVRPDLREPGREGDARAADWPGPGAAARDRFDLPDGRRAAGVRARRGPPRRGGESAAPAVRPGAPPPPPPPPRAHPPPPSPPLCPH